MTNHALAALLVVTLHAPIVHSMDTCDTVFVTRSVPRPVPRPVPRTGPVIDRRDDLVTVDWSGIRARIAENPKLEPYLDQMTVSIHLNGVEILTGIPSHAKRIEVKEVPNRQTDYYVIHKLRGRIIDISDFHLKESADGQNVLPTSFAGRFDGEKFKIEFSDSMKEAGLRDALTENAVHLGYKKVVWVLSPSAGVATRKFVENAKRGVDVEAEMGSDGKPSRLTVVDRATSKRMTAKLDDFYVKVDAAFSGNAFFWDDMLVALATVPYHPHLAESTVRFWLMVQQRNGGVIPREVRKENLLSLWFDKSIRNGSRAKTNLTFTNPYLMNWVADALYRFDPSPKNLALLKEVSKSIDDYATWMEKNRAVRDENGEIIGFNGSALGSGADNSRGEIGNRGEPAAYRTAFVDFISQHISMLNDRARWSRLFADRATTPSEREMFLVQASEAGAKAESYSRILNEKYWNEERGFYFDLRPKGKGHEQNLDYQPITGFWALYAGAAKGDRLRRVVETQFTPETFGGDFPLPANARRAIDPNAKVQYKPRPNFKDEDGYWDKWAHWPSMAMVVIEGLRRSGRPDVAYDLAKKYLIKMAESSSKTVEENYGEIEVVRPDGSKTYRARPGQHASHPHRPDFAGWGKGPPIYLALLDVVGLRPRDDGALGWSLRENLKVGESIAVPNLQFNGGTVSQLKITRISASDYELQVKTEKPFRIALESLTDAEGRLHSSARRRADVALVSPTRDVQRIVLTLTP